jgi:hypothetical protein
MAEGDFTIVLGGETIAVPALTFGQVSDISKVLDDNFEVLRIALEPSRPGITADQLRATKGGIKQLNAAVRAVLESGEFIVPKGKEEPLGEPKAVSE